MLFNFPTFLNKQEQDRSRILFNNIRMVLQTSVKEIWYDTYFGTKIRNFIKSGVDSLVVTEVQNEIETNLMKYFENDIVINYLDLWQENEVIKIALNYTELPTGKFNTVQTTEIFTNTDINVS